MPDPRAPRAWVRQPSGRHLDLINPSPEDFDDSDLALGLARTFRWGGHSVWPRPLTVAQHSLTVLHLRRQSGVLSPRVQLLELLHDAEEGLVGFDPISPLKPILGNGFQSVMQRLQRTVLDRYRVGDWTEEVVGGVVKLAFRLKKRGGNGGDAACRPCVRPSRNC